MSTNTNTDTGSVDVSVSWESGGELHGSSRFTRSQRALISSHWSDVTAYLAPPGTMWTWGETGLPHKVLYNWKEDNLIRRAPDEHRWMTTEVLWCHVIERAGDDEPVGAGSSGQQTLDAPSSVGESRVLVDPTPSSPREPAQVTLDGAEADEEAMSDDVDTSEFLKKRTWGRDPTLPSARERAAAAACQAKLSSFHTEVGLSWDVNPAPAPSVGVRVA